MVLLFFSISLVIIFIYGYLILYFTFGWSKISYFYPIKKGRTQPTIICPLKNEKANLPTLLQLLKKQTYQNFELILVDDNSTDGSWEFLQKLNFNQFVFEGKIVKNKGEGKKRAIKTAIENTVNELIVSLDADCLPNEKWLETIVAFYEKEKSDLIVCPVVIKEGKSFFTQFQRLEFVSLVGSGAGAVGVGKPILCNGANLVFKREEWFKSEKDLHFDEASGDDIYLLQSIKKRGGKIDFLKNKNTIVVTEPKKKIKDFVKQHTRWASKSSALKDNIYFFTAMVVFGVSLCLLVSFVLSFFISSFIYLFISLFFVKYTVDTLFFVNLKSFFSLKNVVLQSFIFSFFYPYYVVFTAILSLFQFNRYQNSFR